MWGQSISMWGEANSSFMAGFEIYDNALLVASSPHYLTNNSVTNIDSFLLINSDTVFYTLSIDSAFNQNQRPHMRLRVKNENTALNVVLVSSAADSEVNYWNVTELDNGAGNWGQNFEKFNNQGLEGDHEYGIGNPASTKNIITVGAHLSELRRSNGSIITGSLASFSSRGPTLDGRVKPDLTAPGVNVISSISSFTNASYLPEANTNFNGRNYEFAAFSGTSMASPVVAGLVALLLEANPTLSAQDVKDILIATAREDDKTGTLPSGGNAEWGAGKATATRAIEMALNYLSVQASSGNQHISVYPNPTTNRLFINGQDIKIQTVEIYNINGVLEKTIEGLSNGQLIISAEDLKPGIHMLKINTANAIFRSRFIKN